MIFNANHRMSSTIGVSFLCSLHSTKAKSPCKYPKGYLESKLSYWIHHSHLYWQIFFFKSCSSHQRDYLGNHLRIQAFNKLASGYPVQNYQNCLSYISEQNALMVIIIHQGKHFFFFLKKKNLNLINKGSRVPVWAYNANKGTTTQFYKPSDSCCSF